MIWVIASIPFWIIAGMAALLGTTSIGLVFFSDRVPTEKENKALGGGITLLAVSGIVALIAAKICS